MNAQQFCAHAALYAAAQWVELGIDPSEAIGMALIEYCGLQITVKLERKKPTESAPVVASVTLTPMQIAIVSVLNVQTPTKAERIAARIGQKNGGSFRAVLADLVRFHIINHVKGQGYLLP